MFIIIKKQLTHTMMIQTAKIPPNSSAIAEKMKEIVYKWIEKGVIATGCIDEIARELKVGGKNE